MLIPIGTQQKFMTDNARNPIRQDVPVQVQEGNCIGGIAMGEKVRL